MHWINYLPTWVSTNMAVLASLNIQCNITPGSLDTDKNAIRADFDTDNRIGRITLWETGECVIEILDGATGDNLYWASRVFNDAEDAAMAWNNFLLLMNKK